MVSYYYFHKRYPDFKGKYNDDLNSFCLEKTDEWIGCLQSAINSRNTTPIYFMRYEELHSNTHNVIKNLLLWLNVHIDSPTINNAICASSFSNLQRQETQSSSNTIEHYFFRSGIIGDSYKKLNSKTLNLICSQTSAVNRKLSYFLIKQKYSLLFRKLRYF